MSRLHLVWEQREPLWYNSLFPQLLLTPDLAQGQNVQPCACEAFLPAFRVRMGVASALPSRRGQGCPNWGYLTVDWQAAKRPMDQRQGGVQQGAGSHVWSGKGLLPRWSKACAALPSLWSMCELYKGKVQDNHPSSQCLVQTRWTRSLDPPVPQIVFFKMWDQFSKPLRLDHCFQKIVESKGTMMEAGHTFTG